MLGRTCQKFKRFNKAYSLAEVLVVMAIIMLIFLALPPVTKKVFKITDTRKAHGRFECYWDVDADGKKALYSYYSDESGLIDGPKKIDGEKCTFTPTSNTLYYMIHAVGGGGAGAVIATQKDEHGNTIVTEDLTPKNTKVQAVSYLTKSAVSVWPKWVAWFNKTNACSQIPWCVSVSGMVKEYKEQFDVNTISDKQQIRYRLGGSAGKVVSSFVPQLPGNLKMEIIPGKGGTISRSKDGSGGVGADTVINYIYPDTSAIEALRATGGNAGNGSVDSKMVFTLVGGKPTDFLMSTKKAVSKKVSGFIDVIESAEKYEAMKSHVPSNAGDGGSGETQFVKDTAGQILYEYDDNGGVWEYIRRYNSNWKYVTDKVSTKYYSNENTSASAKCSLQSAETFEVKRGGYCDDDENATKKTPNTLVYQCGIGNMSRTVVSNLVNASAPSRYSYTWQKFRVSYNTVTKRTSIVPVSSSTYTYDYSDSISYSDDSYLQSLYNEKMTKYYGCTFDTDYVTISCKTKLNNIKIHNCTVDSDSSKECSNGEKAMCSNGGTTYTNCDDASKLKCPAHNGGDGAVVILW